MTFSAVAALFALTGVGMAEPTASEAPPETLEREPSTGILPPDLALIARSVRARPLPERIDTISAALLGRPYVSDPLGEGTGHDADPFARYDVFDCLTFVEEVLSLAMAPDPLSAPMIRNALRYGEGPRVYAKRHHFMELQWIPSARDSGLLVDTTHTYGETRPMVREVTPETWSAWSLRSRFAMEDADLPLGTMHLDVLPLEDAIASAGLIRPGSVLLTVRQDRSWSPIWVSHVSFVLSDGGQPVVRHASRMGTGGTRDHRLSWYLNHLKTYDRLPVVGVAILEPVEQGPRLSTLPGPSGDE